MIVWWSAEPCPLVVRHWWQWHPPVGTFIALLGAVGILVPWLFRSPEEMKRGEKALWTLLVFVLLLLEIRTLYRDREEHDAEVAHAECLQLQSLKDIEADSQRHFDATMGRVGQVFDKTEKAADTATEAVTEITGGTNFAYVAPSPKLTRAAGFSMSVVNDGGTALTGVTVTIARIDKKCRLFPPDFYCVPWSAGPGLMEPILMGTVGPHAWSVLPKLMIPDLSMSGDEDRYRIKISAQNGMVYEYVAFRRARDNNGWAFRYVVFRGKWNRRSGGYSQFKVLRTTDWVEPITRRQP